MTDEVITKDYWTIILLTAMEFVPKEIESREKGEGLAPEKVYTFEGKEACAAYNDYISGKEILVDFHKIERAASLFKKNLHVRR